MIFCVIQQMSIKPFFHSIQLKYRFLFISTKVFVYFINIKSFYRCLQYLKIFVFLFQIVKKYQNYIFKFLKAHLYIFPREVQLTILVYMSQTVISFTHDLAIHNLIGSSFEDSIKVVTIQLKST